MIVEHQRQDFLLFMPNHKKVARYYVIRSEVLSVRPSVRMSALHNFVSAPLLWYRLRYFHETSHQCFKSTMRRCVEHMNATLVCLLMELMELLPFEDWTWPFLPCTRFRSIIDTVRDIFMKLHANMKHYKTACRIHDTQPWFTYLWSYCPLNTEHTMFSCPLDL